MLPPLEAFNGHNVVDNFVRLFVIFTAFTLSLVALKVGVDTVRRREFERAFGVLSFVCFCLNPAIAGIFRFGEPINWWSTSVYLAGLIFGAIATWFWVTVSPPWIRYWTRKRLRRTERKQ